MASLDDFSFDNYQIDGMYQRAVDYYAPTIVVYYTAPFVTESAVATDHNDETPVTAEGTYTAPFSSYTVGTSLT
jgi:hypothetical protein